MADLGRVLVGTASILAAAKRWLQPDGAQRHTVSADTDQSGYAILGGGHEISDILAICAALGVPIVAHHEPDEEPKPDATITLLDEASRSYAEAAGVASLPVRPIRSLNATDFALLIQKPNVKLLVADVAASEEHDSFLKTTKYARETLGFHERVLHLSALCDLYQFPRHRVLLTGVASSGNMIFQNILFELLEYTTRKNPLTEVPLAGRAASFAVNHLVSIRKLFSEYVHDGSLDPITASSTHMGLGQCLIQTEDQYCALSGIPLRSYVWGSQWAATHEPVDKQTLDFYNANGYSILYILRHPLDIIVSNAAKISNVLPGGRRPELALENMDWFKNFVDVMCRYMSGLVSQKDRLAFVRYEALLTDPVPEIDKLASAFEIDVPNGLQEDIWSKLEGVPVAGSQHFWAPGVEKWKSRLHHGHRDIVMASALPALSEQLGYNISANEFGGERHDKSDLPTEVIQALPKMAWIDAVLEIPIGKVATIPGDIVRIKNNEGLVGFFDRAHERKGRALMESEALKTLVDGAYLSGHPPVPTTVREFLTTIGSDGWAETTPEAKN